MIINPGTTNVSTYVVLRKTADHTEMTGAVIADIDLQYVRSGSAPSVKVDATALATTDAAHSDNKAIEVDATDQPGLYRVDWPDAAFATGAREVVLTVKLASCFVEHLKIDLQGPNGTGLIEWDYNLTDSGTGLPIADATIWATTDLVGANVVASGVTDAFGQVTFWLDAGTYYIWSQKSGFTPDANPDLEIVI
jgi:hypothetical protein